jgi:hypothetical protein
VLTAIRDAASAVTEANVHSLSTEHHPTPPVPLPVSLKRVLVQQFTADDLLHLAWLKYAESPGLMARRNLTDEGIEELATMLTDGKIPTCGWWRRAS